jgi:hypothetical protein
MSDSPWPAIIGTRAGTALGAALAEWSKRAERKHARRVQFDAQLLDAAARLSHETTSLHDRLRYRLPVAGIVPTLKSVAQSLDVHAFTEAATLVRLICPLSRAALQDLQIALLGLVNLCNKDAPPPNEDLVSGSAAVLRALARFEKTIRRQLGIKSEINRTPKSPREPLAGAPK